MGSELFVQARLSNIDREKEVQGLQQLIHAKEDELGKLR